MNDDPSDVDPTHKPTENKEPMRMSYDSLLSLKTGSGVGPTDLVLQPGLADSWETPDGQTFTFHLNQSARFANVSPVNGREATSADVKWSLEYLSRTGVFANSKMQPALYGYTYEGMDSVETPDSTTVVVRFGSPYVPFLTYQSGYFASIVPREVFDRDGDFSRTTVGTGPWQLDERQSQRGTHWMYTRNPTYFKQGRPYLNEIDWLVLTEDASQRAAFLAGRLDILGADYATLTPQDLQTIEEAYPRAQRYTSPGSDGGIVFINSTRPPLNDIRVRQAMFFCIDRAEFVKAVGAGGEDWALAGAFPGIFTQKEIEGIVKYDPGQSRQLLTAAGYQNGIQLEVLNGGADRGQREVTMIQLFIAQLKRGGFDVTWHPLDKASEGIRRKTHDFQLDFIGTGGESEEDEALYGYFYSKSAHNYNGTSDPELDRLILAQRREVDAQKRLDICKQAATLVYERGYQMSFFFNLSSTLRVIR
jgi:peptide/nickel transport system substrate-binding protein